MQKPKSISELIRGGQRLAGLRARSAARSETREHVCAALPAPLAATVVSAGLEDGRLTIGVAGAAWASRLRYVTDTLRRRVGGTLGVEITSVRIRVVPPAPRSPG